jgi:hypothetical protein
MDIHDDEAAEAEELREKAEHEYKVNIKQERLAEYIAAGLKIEGFLDLLSEEMWLREIIKDALSPNPFVRTRALSMWGQHQGFLGKGKAKGSVKHDVEFE